MAYERTIAPAPPPVQAVGDLPDPGTLILAIGAGVALWQLFGPRDVGRRVSNWRHRRRVGKVLRRHREWKAKQR